MGAGYMDGVLGGVLEGMPLKLTKRARKGFHGPLRLAPWATNCWPEAPWGGGGSTSLDLRSQPPGAPQ